MIVIGEKINASIPAVKAIIQERDDEKLIELTQKQTAAGSGYIDVNVGTGEGSREDEISLY
jgi:5-methyltetrahydrofolate corrinoid/iron sulfur protein methyltransferase